MTRGNATRSAPQSRSQSGAGEMRATCAPITFRVPGNPAPKGSRTYGQRRNGKGYSRPASRTETTWTEAVAHLACVAAPDGGPLPAPYAVDLVFHMPTPGHPKYTHPTRGDLDKLVRAVLDGLSRGGLIHDDRHVTVLRAVKHWAEPGTEGVVVTVDHAAPRGDDPKGPIDP